ncbi:hypothetical protein OA249_00410 [Litorivicinus sp.]|nr:hypothetical protein [Litorivicinus sp.]
MTISQFLDPTWNALSNVPGEWKCTMSVVLAGMWCVIFGIYTAELAFIGYDILGHIALITEIFVTHRVFRTAREYSPQIADESDLATAG